MPRTPPTVSTMLLDWLSTARRIVPLADGTTGDRAGRARVQPGRGDTGGGAREGREVPHLRRRQLRGRWRLLLLLLQEGARSGPPVPDRPQDRPCASGG